MISQVRQAYGWAGEVAVSPGPRGALGQIWHLETGGSHYALKEIFAEPPSEDAIRAELDLIARTGVRAPASHADLSGRYLLTTPEGTWLRLYDWVDLRPVDLTDPGTPRRLGALLAGLHRLAPASAEPLDPWYDRVPDAGRFSAVAASGALAGHLDRLPELCAGVARADPATFVVCHRDLHPENVLAGPSGELVVVDWDNLGPADPGRELGMALFDWFGDDPAAMRALYRAYVAEGGPGRVTRSADFTMLLACRLNFVLVQAAVALDPDAAPHDREWAEREVTGTLAYLPSPEQLASALTMLQPGSP